MTVSLAGEIERCVAASSSPAAGQDCYHTLNYIVHGGLQRRSQPTSGFCTRSSGQLMHRANEYPISQPSGDGSCSITHRVYSRGRCQQSVFTQSIATSADRGAHDKQKLLSTVAIAAGSTQCMCHRPLQPDPAGAARQVQGVKAG
jgi:hypothetical protein